MSALAVGSRSLTGIEAGRGIAAILVVLYHAGRHLDHTVGAAVLRAASQFGHAGVDFFFVISGFIIWFVHRRDIGDPTKVGRYIERRFTRLMPTYWVALALTILRHVAGSGSFPSLRDLFWSVSLIPSNNTLILDIAWTLRFEVLFYAVFCVLIASRAAGTLLLACWFLAVIARDYLGLESSSIPHQFYSPYCLEFFFGMSAAHCVSHYRIWRPRLIATAGMVLLGAAALSEDLGLLDGLEPAARLAYGVPSALLVVGIASEELRRNFSVPGWLRLCGSASYSIYIFQFVFIGLAWKALAVLRLDAMLPVLVLFVVIAAAAIGGGIVMSLWVEHPMIRIARRRRAAA
jgi:peptidoglycan/LPS O-acetylase OafA/YrhL